MKIAHLVWSFGTGGIETMLVDIVNEQVKTEDVAVFVVNKKTNKSLLKKIDKRVKLFLGKRDEGSKNPFPILKINFSIFVYNPDVIHTHGDKLSNLIFGKYHFVRTIHNTHSSGQDYNRCDRLFCISNAVKTYTASQGYPNGIVVYNGIHVDDISCPKVIRKNLQNPVRLVCVGRLHPMKGQNILVDAMNLLVNDRGIKNISLDLIGDGEMRGEIEKSISTYKLESYINLLGAQPRSFFYPKLKDYDLFVIPSVSEGFGLTLAEACSAKISVLITDIEGPMEVIDYGKYGRSFKCGNPVSLADEIEDFMHCGANVSQIERAYGYVKENFNIENTVQRYITEYKTVIQK